MEIRLSYVQGRTARAHVRDGVLCVRIPQHWPRTEKEAALNRFKRWAARRHLELAALPPPVDRPPMTELELWQRVQAINSETVRVNVTGVRLGSARRTRLAQANCQTGVLTFSRFAVDGLPDRALRYLILHELTHLRIPDHSPQFWDLVGRFEPEWRRLRRLAQTHFSRAVSAPAQPVRPVPLPLPPAPSPLPPPPSPLPFKAASQLPFDAVASLQATDFADDDAGLGAGGYDLDVEPAAADGGPAVQMPLFPGLVPEYEVD